LAVVFIPHSEALYPEAFYPEALWLVYFGFCRIRKRSDWYVLSLAESGRWRNLPRRRSLAIWKVGRRQKKNVL
jgi:hypothetical protein